jgi:hypothetical protein
LREVFENNNKPEIHQDTRAAPGLPLLLKVSPGDENIPLPMMILIKIQTPSTNPRVRLSDPAIQPHHTQSPQTITGKISMKWIKRSEMHFMFFSDSLF